VATSASSATTLVSAPTLSFSAADYAVGAGLGTTSFSGYVSIDAPAPVGGLAVTLSVSANAIARVAQNDSTSGAAATVVTIPAGSTFAYFRVIGVAVGGTAVIASASGHADVSASIDVRPSGLDVSNLATSLSVGQSDTNVSVLVGYLNGLGAFQAQQPVMSDTTVTLTSSNPSVGTIGSSVVIPADASSSATTTFQAVAPGLTTVTASATGFADSDRDTQAVTVNP
jgi:hypothetical protein